MLAALFLLPATVGAATQIYTSNSQVDTWNPIFPTSADSNWPNNACTPVPAVGLGAAWVNPHKAFDFGPGAHPWQPGAGFAANWINAWSNLGSLGPSGQSWTKYSTQVSGSGDFVLNLLADNCSWIYLDGTLVGFQDATLQPRTYPVRLSSNHTLTFIIFDGGGLAGGMYRLETNTGTVFIDSDGDGLANVSETQLYGTNPNNADTDGDGIGDGAEVAAGTNPLVPNRPSDTTAPSIVGSVAPAANTNGWNNTNATVSFTCADEEGGSGLASCGPTPVIVSAEGTTTVTGTATDRAGNSASAAATVNIDKRAPTVSLTGPAIVIQGQAAQAAVSASDALSGVASGTPTSVALDTSAPGTHSVSVTVFDNAGNSATAAISYTVWSVGCGAPPIVKNGAGVGQFKAGSSIPVKCRITDGTNVITSATGTATISNGTTTFSQALKYDPTDQQYVAPVKTEKAASGTYKVAVTISGVGTVAVATIDLR
ncbi:MAG: hypothetical protein EPO26_14565 [Chloroflexota bacterium]|nr:MAG: hypothetical protein EPO26_14565 [Chloroflexota bacterium]